MIKKLYFYWYVNPSGWCDLYDLHIKNLCTYKDIFDSTLFIISYDKNIDSSLISNTKEKIKAVFPNTEFYDFENNKEERESKYFYNEIVLKLGIFNKEDAIFFGHNKGVDSTYVTSDDLLCWINSMYYFNLSDEKKITELLENQTTCAIGTAKIVNYAPPAFVSFCKYKWMFAGTFFWIVPYRVEEYIRKNKINIIPNTGRYYTEGFLGMIFPQEAEEIKCIGGNKVVHETFIDYIKRNLTKDTFGKFIKLHGEIPYNGDLDIFVFAHKNFETRRVNPIYKIVCSNDCDIKSDKLGIIKLDCELSNVGFSEWQKIYELRKRENLLKEYVGLAHYHRYLSFSDDVNFVPPPQIMTELFKQYDILIKHPLNLKNLREQYKLCHNVDDFDTMIDIIKTDFPEWYDIALNCINQGIMFDSNIMILRKDDFIGLCDFVFSVLFKYCEKVGIDKTSDESFIKYVNDRPLEYNKIHKLNDTFNEQARICSYLAERLVIMYISRYLKRVFVLKMVEE